MRTKRWWAVACWIIWVRLLLDAIIYFTLMTTLLLDMSACTPTVVFSLTRDSADAWRGSGFFQVTAAFGSFTFTTAKIIDVAWDMVSAAHPQTTMHLLTAPSWWAVAAR